MPMDRQLKLENLFTNLWCYKLICKSFFLVKSFACSETLLDPDPEGCPGVFQPEVSDPEHSNAGSTAVWELHHLTVSVWV